MADNKGIRSIRMFYAWQSDLPSKFNQFAIKKALRSASADLEEELSVKSGMSVEIIVDDATRGLPGSPHIPSAILDKIQAADIFVADVSSVNSDQADESKKTPNPNVVFELGYAVAHLGWERVILLINEVHGSVENLPFDFDRHRASPFKLADGTDGTQKTLMEMIRFSVRLILEKDPQRPRASRFDPDEARRERDLANLRWVLGSIHWPTIDDHIEAGPKYLTMASAVLSEQVSAIISSSTFHLYDGQLRQAIFEFVRVWNNTMKYDHYVPMRRARSYVFKHGHPSEYAREIKEWEYMDKQRGRLREVKDSLLQLIRDEFPEIDIRGISDAAGVKYDAEMSDPEDLIRHSSDQVSMSSNSGKEKRTKKSHAKKPK